MTWDVAAFTVIGGVVGSVLTKGFDLVTTYRNTNREQRREDERSALNESYKQQDRMKGDIQELTLRVDKLQNHNTKCERILAAAVEWIASASEAMTLKKMPHRKWTPPPDMFGSDFHTPLPAHMAGVEMHGPPDTEERDS